MTPRFTALVSLTFAAAYGLAPLFYSNQNQYFLHGFALAGWGHLDEDWLANTIDPTPLWSIGLAFLVRILPIESVLVLQFALLWLYCWSLLRLLAVVFDKLPPWSLVAGIVLLHSAGFRWLSYRLFGQDYPWYFQSGLAGQYITGAMVQPSVFGVLLVLALAEYLRGRVLLAGVLIAVTGSIHPTYLLPGAMLSAGLLIDQILNRGFWSSIRLAALTLMLVLPVTLHSWNAFAPTSATRFAEAQQILVDVRIPHHSRVDLWLDPIAGLQILWLILGVVFSWRTRLHWLMLVPFLCGVGLTLVQVATKSNALALLFPWRVSAILIPIATGVILARVIRFEIPRVVSVTLLLLLAVAGLSMSLTRSAFHLSDDELPLIEKVKSIRASGQVYLLPARDPELAKKTRGSLSSDFKPLPEKRQDQRVIPIDLQRFRLATGAPIDVDFKSIPYKDMEVLEWHDRLRAAERLYQQLAEGKFDFAYFSLRNRQITHIVWPATSSLRDERFHLIHDDGVYQLYEVK